VHARPLSGSLGTFLKCLRCQRLPSAGKSARPSVPRRGFSRIRFWLDFPPSGRIRRRNVSSWNNIFLPFPKATPQTGIHVAQRYCRSRADRISRNPCICRSLPFIPWIVSYRELRAAFSAIRRGGSAGTRQQVRFVSDFIRGGGKFEGVSGEHHPRES